MKKLSVNVISGRYISFDARISSNTTLLKPRGNTLMSPESALDRGDVAGKHPKQQKIQTFPTHGDRVFL